MLLQIRRFFLIGNEHTKKRVNFTKGLLARVTLFWYAWYEIYNGYYWTNSIFLCWFLVCFWLCFAFFTEQSRIWPSLSRYLQAIIQKMRFQTGNEGKTLTFRNRFVCFSKSKFTRIRIFLDITCYWPQTDMIKNKLVWKIYCLKKLSKFEKNKLVWKK